MKFIIVHKAFNQRNIEKEMNQAQLFVLGNDAPNYFEQLQLFTVVLQNAVFA